MIKYSIATKSKGFTLIELLVTLTIITILAVAVYAALNPAQRLSDTKNARRATDTGEILSAIHQSTVDNKGLLPTNLAGIAVDTDVQLGTGATGCGLVSATSTPGCNIVSTACVDLMADVTRDLIPYLASMPIDPVSTTGGATAAKTGYAVRRDANGIITVKACYTETGTTISVSR